MRLVVIESPYAGATPEIIERNVRYARACMRDALLRGEAPIASHLLYTQPGILDDLVPADRALGIAAGFDWAEKADAVLLYLDLGQSPGMKAAMYRWEQRGKKMEAHYLKGEWEGQRYDRL